MFITFEGGEGCGKTTQLRLLSEHFTALGTPHIVTREPGGSTGAESLRKLLVEGEPEQWDAMTETILFMAARVDHVRKRILPALKKGEVVLCDRFMDSTYVYQGMAKGIDEGFLNLMHDFCLPGVAPDKTLIFDIAPEEGLNRARARHGEENRFERLGLGFHTRVREGFLARAKAAPGRCHVIDASGTPEEVAARVRAALAC